MFSSPSSSVSTMVCWLWAHILSYVPLLRWPWAYDHTQEWRRVRSTLGERMSPHRPRLHRTQRPVRSVRHKTSLKARYLRGGRGQGTLLWETPEKSLSFEWFPRQKKGSGKEHSKPRKLDYQFINGVLREWWEMQGVFLNYKRQAGQVGKKVQRGP